VPTHTLDSPLTQDQTDALAAVFNPATPAPTKKKPPTDSVPAHTLDSGAVEGLALLFGSRLKRCELVARKELDKCVIRDWLDIDIRHFLLTTIVEIRRKLAQLK
jgi:hypothetical protein